MRVLFADKLYGDAYCEVASMALNAEVSAIVLCGCLGDTGTLELSSWIEDQPVPVFLVPGPSDGTMLLPENIECSIRRVGHFEFSGFGHIPDDGRINKSRCRRDDEYFDFPKQVPGVPADWMEAARGLPSLSTLLAELPTPHNFSSTVYILPPPYGVSFSSDRVGKPCPTCHRPFEPYIPLEGSRAVRRFIEDRQPGMTVHFHDGMSWSEKMVGKTKSVLLGVDPCVYDLFTRERIH